MILNGMSTGSRSKGNAAGPFKTMKEIAWAAYNAPPPNMEPGFEAVKLL
jgi:carbon-monoxide dehydrogenase large subunit